MGQILTRTTYPGNQLITFDRLVGHTLPVTCIDTFYYNRDPFIISGSNDATLKVWHNNKCIHTLIGHTSAVTSVSVVSLDFAISGSLDGTIKLWDLSSGECITTFNHDRPVIKVVTVGENNAVSWSECGKIVVWDFIRRSATKTFYHGDSHTQFLSYHGQEGGAIFTASDHSIKRWSIRSDKMVWEMNIENKTINAMTSLFLQPCLFIAATNNQHNDEYERISLFDKTISKNVANIDLTQDICTVMGRDGWQIVLACSNNNVFRLYDSFRTGLVIWTGVDSENAYKPSVVNSINNNIIYASNDTNDIMVSNNDNLFI